MPTQQRFGPVSMRTPADLGQYVGATVLRPTGETNGTIVDVASDSVTIERGGVRDLMGFLDLRPGTRILVPVNLLLFGKARSVGRTLVIGPQ